jgi:hypothetical protein
MEKGLKIKRFAVVSLFLLQALPSGCSSAGDAPAFLETPSGDISVVTEEPAVNEELANAAWEQRLIYHVGPVDLPAHTEGATALDHPLILRFQTDEAVWVTGFTPRVVDAGGSELPATLLHEAMISNLHEANDLCGTTTEGNPVFIATSLLTEVKLPQGFGYPVLTTDPLEARVILVNPTDQSYVGVFFEIALEARTMNEFSSMEDVKPMLVEPIPCTHESLAVEPGSFTERTATHAVETAGKVVAIAGVLQDYGSELSLSMNGSTEPFWRAEAKLDAEHHLIGLTNNPLFAAGAATFKTGDPITLHITYDNVSSFWLQGATAAAMVYVAPAN